MSRVGRLPVEVPSGVDVKIDGSHVKIKGPKGEMEFSFSPDIAIVLEEGLVNITRPSDARDMRSRHGTTRALIQNMVIGVTDGFIQFKIAGGAFARIQLPVAGCTGPLSSCLFRRQACCRRLVA